MTVQVIFIQGAGSGAYDEDKLLAENLQHNLGAPFTIHYPAMPNEDDAPIEQWRQVIAQELASMQGPVVLVGHSVGASILLKWLSERKNGHDLAGVFLAACPFWGGAGWLYEGYEELELAPGFASALPADTPVYLYHCRDDEVVPFAHLALYAQALPQATVRVCEQGGHQFNNDLSAVAQDIATNFS